MNQHILQADYSFAGGVPATPFKIHDSISSRIDKEYVQFFDEHLTENANILYTHRVPLTEIRKGGNVMPGQSPLSSIAKTFDIEILREFIKEEAFSAPIPARVFVPMGEKPKEGWPLFIWFHGGGWVLGNISTENSFCTKIASLSKCIVMSVDYRLAPENPFPAAVNDAYEALLYGFGKATSELGINPRKIAIGGSSAGGNLTAVITHKFSNSTFADIFPPVVFQLLVVPVTDNSATPESQPSWKENEFTPQLPAEKMLWYRKLYLPNGDEDLQNPEASPLFYPDNSFTKLPPCLILAAECDVLRSEAEAYNEKLIKNGINSKIIIYSGVPHPVMAMDAVLQKGRDLGKDAADAIRDAFY